MICLVCGSDFDPKLSASMPFCSERCRQVDLNRWLNEEYGLPWVPKDEEELEDFEEADGEQLTKGTS